MNRFNLTFWGEILPGKDPEQVKARFAKLFDISDPERLEHFFTGETIILRRNLDRKVAGEYYHKLHKLGVEAELVKVTAETLAPASEHTESQADNEWETVRRQAELEALQRRQQDPDREDRKRQQAAAFKAKREQEAKALAAQKVAELEAKLKREEEQAEALRARQREAEEAERKQAEAEKERQRKAEEVARKKAQEVVKRAKDACGV